MSVKVRYRSKKSHEVLSRKSKDLLEEGFFLGDSIDVREGDVTLYGKTIDEVSCYFLSSFATNKVYITSIDEKIPEIGTYAYFLVGKFLYEYELKNLNYYYSDGSFCREGIVKETSYYLSRIMKVLNDAEKPVLSKIKLLGNSDTINGFGWSNDEIQKFIDENTEEIKRR